ncbi:hypothetical protein HJFPF1_02487 [Paramyrothecium foliicola]|nr:hypothetical protein HJFPF1_02487 [Paramyrothecium foliicola]
MESSNAGNAASRSAESGHASSQSPSRLPIRNLKRARGDLEEDLEAKKRRLLGADATTEQAVSTLEEHDDSSSNIAVRSVSSAQIRTAHLAQSVENAATSHVSISSDSESPPTFMSNTIIIRDSPPHQDNAQEIRPDISTSTSVPALTAVPATAPRQSATVQRPPRRMCSVHAASASRFLSLACQHEKLRRQTLRNELQHRMTFGSPEYVLYRQFLSSPVGRSPNIEEETEAIRMWNMSPERAECALLSLPQHSHILHLWTVCLQFQTRPTSSPFSIISCARGLVGAKSNSPYEPTVLWSPRFCMNLAKLIMHPFCEESTNLISFFIRFTVACRSGSSIIYPFWNGDGCMVLGEVERAMDKGLAGRQLYVFLENTARQSEQRQPLSVPCKILLMIGRALVANAHLFPPTSLVLADDLNCILCNLNQVHGFGRPSIFEHADIIFERYRMTAPRQTPPSVTELRALHEAAYLREFKSRRLVLRNLGRPPSAPSTENGGSPVGSRVNP